jgi:hypothetical protein
VVLVVEAYDAYRSAGDVYPAGVTRRPAQDTSIRERHCAAAVSIGDPTCRDIYPARAWASVPSSQRYSVLSKEKVKSRRCAGVDTDMSADMIRTEGEG